MNHQLSPDDMRFLQSFESCIIDAQLFHHREHLRLAYILLVQCDLDRVRVRLKDSLIEFLRFNGVDESKYHETMTYAWLLTIQHFMQKTTPCSGSKEFLAKNETLLDKDLIFSHYTRELLYSGNAQKSYIEPDLNPIHFHDQ